MKQKNKRLRDNNKQNNRNGVYRLVCEYWNSGFNLCILKRLAAKSSQLDKKKNGILLFGKYLYYCKHENNKRIEKYKIQNKTKANHNN